MIFKDRKRFRGGLQITVGLQITDLHGVIRILQIVRIYRVQILK